MTKRLTMDDERMMKCEWKRGKSNGRVDGIGRESEWKGRRE